MIMEFFLEVFIFFLCLRCCSCDDDDLQNGHKQIIATKINKKKKFALPFSCIFVLDLTYYPFYITREYSIPIHEIIK